MSGDALLGGGGISEPWQMAEEKLSAAQAVADMDFFCAASTMAEIDLMGKPWDAHLISISDISEMKIGKGKDERVSLIALMDADRSFPVSLEQAPRRREVLMRDILRDSMLAPWSEERSSRARSSELAKVVVGPRLLAHRTRMAGSERQRLGCTAWDEGPRKDDWVTAPSPWVTSRKPFPEEMLAMMRLKVSSEALPAGTFTLELP